jgi:hypothetical protein
MKRMRGKNVGESPLYRIVYIKISHSVMLAIEGFM